MKKTLVLAIVAGMLLISSAEVCAVNYYVDATGGNDINDGRSDATAWQTISKVNNYTFQTGDDVYFKCGGTWEYGTSQWPYGLSLNIDWDGTAENQVIIGAYYGDGVIGVSGNRPVIDGNHVAPGPLPCEGDGCYTGLVRTSEQIYIDIENISIKNSEGYGLKFEQSNDCNAYNVKTDNTYRSGIHFKNCNTNGGSSIVDGCEVVEYARVWPEYCSQQTPRCTWPAGIVGSSTKNMIIRKNIVHEGHGEGIYLGNLWNDNGSNALIEDNIVYDCRSVSIYTHNIGDIVIRRNLVYGTGNPTYCNRFVYDGVYFAGPGIYVCDEDWPAGYHMDNIEIYDNLVAFTNAGLHIGNSRNSFSNSVVYNNVFVDNHTSIGITGYLASNSFIKNNIFWCISDDCTIYTGRDSVSGIEFSNNLWSSMPPDGIQGPNDIYSLPQLTKTSGWRSLTAGSLKGSDFTLQPNSPAIDAGINLPSPYNQGLNPASIWPNNVSILDQNNCGTDWEIGAYVFTGTDADINDDGKVNIEDFAVLSVWWDDENACSTTDWCEGADFNMSGTVDMLDLTYFVENWLR